MPISKRSIGSLTVPFLFVFVLAVSMTSPGRALAMDSWDTITPGTTSGYTFNTILSVGDYVYLGTDHGVYKSSDDGATWNPINTGLSGNALHVTSIAIGWTYDFDAGSYVVTNATPVYIGTGSGVYATTIGNSSDTWTAKNTGLSDTDVKDVEINQDNAINGTITELYAATPSGVFKSANSGTSWSLELSGHSVSKLASVAGLVYAMTNSNTVFATSSSQAWTQVYDANGTTTKDISVLQAVGDIVWISTNKGILKSDENGANWTPRNVTLPVDTINMVSSDYIDPNIAYAATGIHGIYRTTNEAFGFPDWLPISGALTDTNMRAVVTDPTDSNLVYAIGGSGIYRLHFSGNPTIDLTPPSNITDLSVSVLLNEGLVLSWSSPGGDDTHNYADHYEVRYSNTGTITDQNWSAATPITGGLPTPYTYGYAQQLGYYTLTPNASYYFAVKAVDAAGNHSSLSNPAFSDITQPTIDTFIIPATATSKTFDITALSATDGVGVTGYIVNESSTAPDPSDSAWQSVPPTTFTTTSGGSHTLYAWAKDSSGNIGRANQTITINIPDTTPPTDPTLFNIDQNPGVTTSLTMSWIASTDDVGVSGYVISRDGVEVRTVVDTFFTDSNLTPSTQYTYSIYAFDGSGKHSGTVTATGRTPSEPAVDTTPPSNPGNLSAVAQSTTQVNIYWSAATDTGGSIARYDVYRDGVLVAGITELSYYDSGRSAGTTYTYTVKAIDLAGNPSSGANISGSTNAEPNPGGGGSNPPYVPPSGGGGGGGGYTPPSSGGGGGAPAAAANTSNYAFTLTKTGQGSVVSYPASISCGVTCTAQYSANTAITLIASPSAGSHLATWTGCNIISGNLCFVTVTSIRLVKANFAVGGSPVTVIDTAPYIGPTYVASTYTAANQNYSAANSGAAVLPPLPSSSIGLTIGSRTPAVLTLQNFLIAQSFLGPTYNTGYYGSLTDAAVTKYNAALALQSSGAGSTVGNYYGIGTGSLTGGGTPASSTAPVAIKGLHLPQFTRTLKVGSVGQDVTNLQKFLNNYPVVSAGITTYPFRVAVYGNGAPGKETTYLGPATSKAITLFQQYYAADILTPVGLRYGTGNFGPSTMKKVNELR